MLVNQKGAFRRIRAGGDAAGEAEEVRRRVGPAPGLRCRRLMGPRPPLAHLLEKGTRRYN